MVVVRPENGNMDPDGTPAPVEAEKLPPQVTPLGGSLFDQEPGMCDNTWSKHYALRRIAIHRGVLSVPINYYCSNMLP
jgi:hypothetical protein